MVNPQLPPDAIVPILLAERPIMPILLAERAIVAGIWDDRCDECWLPLAPDDTCPRCDDPARAVPLPRLRALLRAAGVRLRRGDGPGCWLLVSAGHTNPVHIYYHPEEDPTALTQLAAARVALLAASFAVAVDRADDGTPYLRVWQVPAVLVGGEARRG